MVKTYKPMSLTKGEKKEFRKNSICHICEEKIEGEVKVRDHCHLIGKMELIPVVILITSLQALFLSFFTTTLTMTTSIYK